VNFKDIARLGCPWACAEDKHSGIALCTRIRLARNFTDIPFPNRASADDLKTVSESALFAAGKIPMLKNAVIRRMDELEPLDVQFLLERHLISREFTKKPAESVIIMGEGGVINIMVNEEDHLRLQVMKPGLDALEAWSAADRLETELGREIDFSFSNRWGYLTACPTNIGTGLRASVMVHLPALVISRRIVKVLTRISKSGIAPRGAYGEGSEPSGNLFQLSNQFTLGKTEESIVKEIEKAALGVIEEEESARTVMLAGGRRSLEDRIFRALGVLKSARMISSGESLELLSQLKLGASLDIIEIGADVLDELIMDVRPAHLQKKAGGGLSRRERDAMRADLIRSKLGG
jgi:protein arginine kinase